MCVRWDGKWLDVKNLAQDLRNFQVFTAEKCLEARILFAIMIVSRACKERIHSALKYEQIMNLPEMALKNFVFRIFRKTLAKMGSQSLYLWGCEGEGRNESCPF